MCLCALSTFSQKYSTTLGVRMGGETYGAAIQQKVFKSFAVEGIMSGNGRELTGTLLLEKHFPLVGKGLNAYIGAGAHMGGLKDFGPTLGADALVGVELKIPLLPLVVSADFKPAYHIVHEEWFDANTAVSVRYIIGKESKKQRQRKREKKKRRKERAKEKKQWLKEREKRKKERAKEKAKRQKEKAEQQPKKLFEDVHLLKIFKKEKEEDIKDKKKKRQKD